MITAPDAVEPRQVIRFCTAGGGVQLAYSTISLDFDPFVDELEPVVAATGIGRFALLGNSQGGAVSIAYAVRHSVRVSHLIDQQDPLCLLFNPPATVHNGCDGHAVERTRDEAMK